MAWQDELQPASWRDLPFFVETASGSVGRATAVHSYPFREEDFTYVEDLGRLPTTFRVIGFLLGEDVRQQHLDFYEAVIAPGSGSLVHPVYGEQTGSIVGGCRFDLRRDKGRYVEFSFDFIVNNGEPVPDAEQPDTQDDVATASGNAQAAAASDYQRKAGSPPSALLKKNNSAGSSPPSQTAIV